MITAVKCQTAAPLASLALGVAALVALRIRRGRRWDGRRWRPLAGQILEGLEEAAAVKKTHEGDDVAAGDAAAEKENLFSGIDAEAILAAA